MLLSTLQGSVQLRRGHCPGWEGGGSQGQGDCETDGRVGLEAKVGTKCAAWPKDIKASPHSCL